MVDWASLARLDGTLVCYAGPQQLPQILQALAAVRPSDETAALIYNGTLPTQQTISGSLGEVARAVKHASDRRAGVLVVGRVAALREYLRWFDVRPLFGKRVLVTRPREQAGELVDRLEAMGAEAIEAPMIRIAPPEDHGSLDEACANAGAFDWIVFSSVNAVEAFLDRLQRTPLDLRALGGVKLCVVGSATAERLARHGLKADLVPGEYRAEAVLEALSRQGDLRGLKVLLPRADVGREIIAEGLRKHGVAVTEVVAYRTVAVDPERDGEPDVYRMLLDRRIDVVTFTSASAVRSLVRVLGAEPAADLLRTTVVASIGPVTAQVAAQYQIQSTVVPAEFTVPALVGAIVAHYTAERSRSGKGRPEGREP
jgi:uroporphyrinogen III methyltransferase/synthase